MDQPAEKKSTHQTARRKAVLLAVCLLLVVSVSLLHISQTTGLRHAVTLATTHQPERFTELYFSDAATVPTSTPVDTLRSFNFRLVNHEAARTTYRYHVDMTINDTMTYAITDARLNVADGQAKDIPVSFKVPVENAHIRIRVQLVDRTETIAFGAES